ncbi:hypothetical protein L7F22_069413 [Adiantum nelumboides]|nr:hypothetical protein [Adiantum nelumboides]
MTDILKGLATLSKTFQRDHVDVTNVKSLVDNQISRIKEYYIEDPKLDCNALTHGVGGFEILQEYGSPKGHLFTLREALRGNMFYDEEIKRDICGEDLRNALEFQFSFASAIITNLECRFEDNTILNNMKIFVPAQFPLLERALKVFGNVEVENLAKFYGKKQRIGILDFDPIIDGDDLKNEFKTFKNQAPKDFVRYSLTEVTSCIASNVMWRDEYPNLLTLCQVALVQCSSIAMCERGFSARTIIKSNIRNRLEIKSLDALMKIAIEGPPTLSKDELLESIEMWSEKAHRHLFTSQASVKVLASIVQPEEKDLDKDVKKTFKSGLDGYIGTEHYFKFGVQFTQLISVDQCNLAPDYFKCRPLSGVYVKFLLRQFAKHSRLVSNAADLMPYDPIKKEPLKANEVHADKLATYHYWIHTRTLYLVVGVLLNLERLLMEFVG